MKITNLKKLKPKKLIVFDLDGTLAPTKSPMDKQMTTLMAKLIEKKKVAAISGAKIDLFKLQLLEPLNHVKHHYGNLFLFPTTGTTFLRYNKGWKKVYSLKLSKKEAKQIKDAFNKVFKEIGYEHPKKVYGELIENRGSQVSFSVYGQDIVKVLGKKGIRIKEEWREKHTPIKMKIAKLVSKYLPKLEVRAAGYTTIDVTRKGIDKAYGLHQMEKYIGVKIKDMLFVGDAIFPGGNDYAIVKTGVDYIPVKNPKETQKVIKYIIDNQ